MKTAGQKEGAGLPCGRCGHAFALHGRRGYGACRRPYGLALAVDVLEAGTAAKMPAGVTMPAVAEAMRRKPCSCKRFRSTARKVVGSNG